MLGQHPVSDLCLQSLTHARSASPICVPRASWTFETGPCHVAQLCLELNLLPSTFLVLGFQACSWNYSAMEFFLSQSLTQGPSPPFSHALLPCLLGSMGSKNLPQEQSSGSAGIGEERRWLGWGCHQPETLCSCALGDKLLDALFLGALGNKMHRNLDQSPVVPTMHCVIIIPPCISAGSGETCFYSTERRLSVLHTEPVSELGVKPQPVSLKPQSVTDTW